MRRELVAVLPADAAVSSFQRSQIHGWADPTSLDLRLLEWGARTWSTAQQEITRTGRRSRGAASHCGRTIRRALLATRVVKESEATFRPLPGMNAHRVRPRTSIRNLVLAGAWTATGWPATMESAVRSGRAAAQELLEEQGSHP